MVHGGFLVLAITAACGGQVVHESEAPSELPEQATGGQVVYESEAPSELYAPLWSPTDASAPGPPPGSFASTALPDPVEPVVRNLGEAPWKAVALAPGRDAIAVATPSSVQVLSLPSRDLMWRVEGPSKPLFVAFAADARTIAVLSRSGGRIQLQVVGADDGATQELQHVRSLRRPPSRSRSHRSPRPAASGLVGAPGGGFWILNAYGRRLVKPGPGRLTQVEVPEGEKGQLSQSGQSFWRSGYTQVWRVDGDDPGRVELGCYAQFFAVDERVDRVLSTCAGKGGTPGTVRLARLSTGELLREVPLAMGAHGLYILGPDRFLVQMFYPAQVVWSGPSGELEIHR